MGGRYQISRRKRRILSALIATTVTTIVALSAISVAEGQSCTLRDVDDWHQALNDPDMEQSPDYILNVTSRFLDACPMRPERFEAFRVAGMAAVDLGDVSLAVQHFRDAGRMTNVLANFYAISAFATVGDQHTAWRIRDQMIERWRDRLERNPNVSVRAIPRRRGMIYELKTLNSDRADGLISTWVAVPFGPGWPASMSVSEDRFRASLRRVAKAGSVSDVVYIDLHRCSGRHALDQVQRSPQQQAIDETALDVLSAYMSDPDKPKSRSKQIELCVWPSRLIPQVSQALN